MQVALWAGRCLFFSDAITLAERMSSGMDTAGAWLLHSIVALLAAAAVNLMTHKGTGQGALPVVLVTLLCTACHYFVPALASQGGSMGSIWRMALSCLGAVVGTLMSDSWGCSLASIGSHYRAACKFD